MNFIREKETKYMLDNYKSITPKSLTNYLLKYNNDADCVYIFNNLPQDLQKTIDDLAGEVVKANSDKIKANSDKIKANSDKIKANSDKIKAMDAMIEFVTQYNKQLDDDIYRLQHKLENTRELNRQLELF